MHKIKRTCSGILIMMGFLLMTSLEPGETLGPYIAVIAAALAAVIAGAKLGRWTGKEKEKQEG